MAIRITDITKMTRSGIFVRSDPGFGLLAHSPYTGLTYAIHPSDIETVNKWLNSPSSQPPSEIYKFSLGADWAICVEEAKHPIPHLLPDQEAWSIVPTPASPILINWFLTGRCPLACTYCYAEDLMRNDALEPTSQDIKRTAEAILNLNPLVVVLTGGDPLFSPYLAEAVRLLSGKVGIVVDTSGYTFTNKHLELFKRHKVGVRISFDSERPRVNQSQRPIYSGYPKLVKTGPPTAEAAIDALCKCLDAGLSVTVQTVATKKTANDLIALGDKLFRIGVRSWRIFKVAPSEARYDGYLKLVGTFTDSGKRHTAKKARGPYEFIFKKVLDSRLSHWQQAMAVQVTHNEKPNAVILVGPDGNFYTESNVSLGKILLDEISPGNPTLEAVRSKVNMLAHAERYLNLTTHNMLSN
jgi:MoaA/NifB/PqqE/SkfB family radical SAM enzyme